MKKTILAALAGAVLAATPAFAQFEGEITMKLTMREGSGTGKAYVSKAGARSELDIQTAKMPFRMTTLMKFVESRRHVHDQRQGEDLRRDGPRRR